MVHQALREGGVRACNSNRPKHWGLATRLDNLLSASMARKDQEAWSNLVSVVQKLITHTILNSKTILTFCIATTHFSKAYKIVVNTKMDAV